MANGDARLPEVPSRSAPTVQGDPPRLRSRTTRVAAPPDRSLTVGAGAVWTAARRETVESTRTTSKVRAAPVIQPWPDHSASKGSRVTPTPRPRPCSTSSSAPVAPGAVSASSRAARWGDTQPGPADALVRFRGPDVPSSTGPSGPPRQATLPVSRNSRRTVVEPLRGTTTVRPSALTREGAPPTPGAPAGVAAYDAVRTGACTRTLHLTGVPNGVPLPTRSR